MREGDGADARGDIPMAGGRAAHGQPSEKGGGREKRYKKCRSRGNGRKKIGPSLRRRRGYVERDEREEDGMARGGVGGRERKGLRESKRERKRERVGGSR